MEREWRPNTDMIPHCPRCGSSNTKFCYYNNYSLTQPRYFCKGCRRYWTKGGSLRNVPVGGGCRKNRRSKASSLRTSSSSSADHRDCFPKNISINQTTYGGNNLDPAKCSMDPVVGSSMAPTDGPNIDLAVVYAKYVNQPQGQNPPVVVLELPTDHHHRPIEEVGLPPFDTSSVEEVPELNLDQEQVQFNPGGDCLLTYDVSQSIIIPGSQLYMTELDSSSVGIMQQEDRINERFTSHDTRSNNAFELPPLPGEDISSSQDNIPLSMPWLDSQIVSDHSLPSSSDQMQMHGLQTENQDLNQLVGNWSPFDLPNYETLSRH